MARRPRPPEKRQAIGDLFTERLDYAPFVIIVMGVGVHLIINSYDYSDLYYGGFVLLITATYVIASAPPRSTDTRAAAPSGRRAGSAATPNPRAGSSCSSS